MRAMVLGRRSGHPPAAPDQVTAQMPDAGLQPAPAFDLAAPAWPEPGRPGWWSIPTTWPEWSGRSCPVWPRRAWRSWRVMNPRSWARAAGWWRPRQKLGHGPFILANADVLCSADPRPLMDHLQNTGAVACLGLVDWPEVNSVALGPHGRVRGFLRRHHGRARSNG